MATAMHGNGESLWRMLAGVVILLREVSDFLETVGEFSVFLPRPSPQCPAFVLIEGLATKEISYTSWRNQLKSS